MAGATIASCGSVQPVAGAFAAGRCAISTRSGSTSDVPVSSPIALKKVQAIAPPIEEAVDLGEQRLDHVDLARDLASRRGSAMKGRFGVSSAPPRYVQLTLHQQTGDRRVAGAP